MEKGKNETWSVVLVWDGLPCIEVAPKYTGVGERESDFRGRRGRKREKEKERKRTESVTQDRHNDENKKTMDKKRNQNRETWISVLFRELFEFGWKLRRSWKSSSIWRFGFLENFEGAQRLLQRFQISADVSQTVENKLYSNSEHF